MALPPYGRAAVQHEATADGFALALIDPLIYPLGALRRLRFGQSSSDPVQLQADTLIVACSVPS